MKTSMRRIFISIASYRDEFLPYTIASALKGARKPEALRFGICWQRDPEENLDAYRDDDRFRILEYAPEDSQGYGWARAEVQKLYQDEEYHLLIDSHTHFADGWDEALIEQLKCKPSQKPLLTTSSPPFRLDDDGNAVFPWADTKNDGVPHMKVEQWPNWGWLDIQMSRERSKGPNTPTYLLCCNFLFTYGRWIREVPEDPGMVNACHESGLAVRSYTHGWDSFLPDSLQVWHLDYSQYSIGRRLKLWEIKPRQWQSDQTHSMMRRLDALIYGIGDPSILGRYGLGTERPIEEWAEKAGVTLIKPMT